MCEKIGLLVTVYLGNKFLKRGVKKWMGQGFSEAPLYDLYPDRRVIARGGIASPVSGYSCAYRMIGSPRGQKTVIDS